MLPHIRISGGVKALLEYANRLKKREYEVQIVVPDRKSKWFKLYQEAGFEFEYHYRPIGNKLREIFDSCDIFLCPSWFEGLGMPSMEAMSCWCALVTIDTGGSRDYAIHEETALVSPPKDVDAFSRNLIRVLHDLSLRKKIAEEGQRKINSFDWEKNCDRLEKIFHQSVRTK